MKRTNGTRNCFIASRLSRFINVKSGSYLRHVGAGSLFAREVYGIVAAFAGGIKAFDNKQLIRV